MTNFSKLYRFGKFVAIEYPDVYFHFVSKLYKEHPDLVEAMHLAQVKMTDGSAIDFLNIVLGTSVKRDTPMELGYADLLDALNKRSRTIITGSKVMEIAAKQASDLYLGFKRSEEEIGKPLFPSLDELNDTSRKH